MIIKHADDRTADLAALEALLLRPDVDARQRRHIEDEMWAIRRGVQGESEAAYQIDFAYGSRSGRAVIHDLRVEHEGRTAQIDHLILNPALDAWVCETKSFSGGVAINEFGEWSRLWHRERVGMASPIEQNERHIAVLRDLFGSGRVQAPRRVGLSIMPKFHNVVLVSNDAKIVRPPKSATRAVEGIDNVVKSEQLAKLIERSFEQRNILPILARVVTAQTVVRVARDLVALHMPVRTDWPARFGLPPETPRLPSPIRPGRPRAVSAHQGSSRQSGPACDHCDRPVTEKEAAYCRAQSVRFGGSTLCFDCQRQPASIT